MLETGQKAPDFKLYNTQKQEVALSSQQGRKVVLLFFPLAFTSTCTAELCSVRDDISFYNGLNATVFGISTDSLFSLGKFRQEQNLNFELLSDYNKVVSAAYNSLYEKFGYGMKGVSKRAAFVIDSKGIVRHIEILEEAGKVPDFEKIKNTLESID